MNCLYFEPITELCEHPDNRLERCHGPRCKIRKTDQEVLTTKKEIFETAKTMAHCVLWLLYLSSGKKYAIVEHKGELKNPFLTI